MSYNSRNTRRPFFQIRGINRSRIAVRRAADRGRAVPRRRASDDEDETSNLTEHPTETALHLANRLMTRAYQAQISDKNAGEASARVVVAAGTDGGVRGYSSWQQFRGKRVLFTTVEQAVEERPELRTLQRRSKATPFHRRTIPPPKRATKSNETAIEAGFLMDSTELIQEKIEERLRVVLSGIDETDCFNQLAVAEYVEDIYGFYRLNESVIGLDFLNEVQECFDEADRKALFDWVVHLHGTYELMHETLYLTIYLIDRYLSKEPIHSSDRFLLGAAAMFAASKYEEVWYPPVGDFASAVVNSFTKEQILEMETKLVKTLDYKLWFATPYYFLLRYFKAAGTVEEVDTFLSHYLCELCLMEYDMLRYPPSHIAAAALYAAQYCMRRRPYWSDTLKSHSGYSEDDIKETARLMVEFHRTAARHAVSSALRDKYKQSIFKKVACLDLPDLPP